MLTSIGGSARERSDGSIFDRVVERHSSLAQSHCLGRIVRLIFTWKAKVVILFNGCPLVDH